MKCRGVFNPGLSLFLILFRTWTAAARTSAKTSFESFLWWCTKWAGSYKVQLSLSDTTFCHWFCATTSRCTAPLLGYGGSAPHGYVRTKIIWLKCFLCLIGLPLHFPQCVAIKCKLTKHLLRLHDIHPARSSYSLIKLQNLEINKWLSTELYTNISIYTTKSSSTNGVFVIEICACKVFCRCIFSKLRYPGRIHLCFCPQLLFWSWVCTIYIYMFWFLEP